MGLGYVDQYGRKQESIYQDVWVKGRVAERGGRECELRFWAIYQAIKKLNRPVKVLDIGANMGYFSIRLAEKLDGLFLMAEGASKTGQALLRVTKLNENPKLMLLKRFFSMEDFPLLQEEHFDVVLALSVIHHFHEPYQKVLEGLMKMGDYLVLEPPVAHEATFNQRRVIGEPLDLSGVNKKLLIEVSTGHAKSESWLRPTWWIDCRQGKENARMPSLGLNTFLRLGGVWPDQEVLDRYIQECDQPADQIRLIPEKLYASYNNTSSRRSLHAVCTR